VDGFYGWTGPAGASDPATAQLAARSEADVLAVIAEVRRAYAVDSAQVFLLGHSMGAIGTWHLAQKFPERWAALAPIAGLGDPSSVERFRHIPQIVVHGDADATVNVAGSRAMVARAKALGATVEYIEVPGGSHTNIAVPNLARIFAFFAEQGR
jgi:predicted peptidase